eukprot:UN03671
MRSNLIDLYVCVCNICVFLEEKEKLERKEKNEIKFQIN